MSNEVQINIATHYRDKTILELINKRNELNREIYRRNEMLRESNCMTIHRTGLRFNWNDALKKNVIQIDSDTGSKMHRGFTMKRCETLTEAISYLTMLKEDVDELIGTLQKISEDTDALLADVDDLVLED